MTQYLVEEALTTGYQALEQVILRRQHERDRDAAAVEKGKDDVAAVLEAARTGKDVAAVKRARGLT